jgi:hypothetical protein
MPMKVSRIHGRKGSKQHKEEKPEEAEAASRLGCSNDAGEIPRFYRENWSSDLWVSSFWESALDESGKLSAGVAWASRTHTSSPI